MGGVVNLWIWPQPTSCAEDNIFKCYIELQHSIVVENLNEEMVGPVLASSVHPLSAVGQSVPPLKAKTATFDRRLRAVEMGHVQRPES